MYLLISFTNWFSLNPRSKPNVLIYTVYGNILDMDYTVLVRFLDFSSNKNVQIRFSNSNLGNFESKGILWIRFKARQTGRYGLNVRVSEDLNNLRKQFDS